MIPKKIHYCWFGRNSLPTSAQRCIASWHKFLPDFEIIEWNEDNFDVNIIQYTREAYEAKKYAFVSDYARFKILYDHGGLYFDTDVEVIKPMDDIIANGPFMGFEIDPGGKRKHGAVNPGLGMGAEPGLSIYKTILDYYHHLNFILSDGRINITDAVVNITTRELAREGLKEIKGIQKISGITIYTSDYFNPYDSIIGKLRISDNTVSIHWFDQSWGNTNPYIHKAKQVFHLLFGKNIKNFFSK